MKRLGRWLFNLAAGVSLLLFILIAALWIRSEFVHDVWSRVSVDPATGTDVLEAFATEQGGFALILNSDGNSSPSLPSSRWMHASEPARGAMDSVRWMEFYHKQISSLKMYDL